MVLVFAVFGDVVAVGALGSGGGGLFALGARHLAAHGGELGLRLFEVGRGLGQVAAHGRELDLLRGDAGLELGQAFDGSGGAGLEHAAVHAAGLQGLLGFHQVVLGVGELLFEEQAALLRLGHGQAVQQAAELFHVSVGDLRCDLRVLVVDVDADEPVLAAGDDRAGFQGLARVLAKLGFVAVHELEAVHHRIEHAAALHEGDVLVGGVLDARGRAGQATERAQAGEHGGGAALLLLRRHEFGAGGKGGRDGKGDAQRQQACGQRADDQQPKVLGHDLQQVQQADFVVFRQGWDLSRLGGVAHRTPTDLKAAMLRPRLARTWVQSLTARVMKL